MLQALKDTINPNGGHGMFEAIIAIVLAALVGGLIYLNIKGIEVSPTIEYVVTILLGYIVGTNKKPTSTWDGIERREEEEQEHD